MISQKTYHEQITLLEGLIAWKITEQSYKAWKKALEEDGFTDTHLVHGVSKIKDWLRDPEKKLRGQDVNYGTFARACGYVRKEYVLYESEEERKKRAVKENEAAKKNTINDILQKGRSPVAGDFINNLRDYLNGIITRKDWAINQKQLSSKHFGKCQAVIDREVKRLSFDYFLDNPLMK